MLGIHPKVQNPALAGAITVVAIWALKAFLNQEVPAEIASAFSVIVMSVTGYGSSADSK